MSLIQRDQATFQAADRTWQSCPSSAGFWRQRCKIEGVMGSIEGLALYPASVPEESHERPLHELKSEPQGDLSILQLPGPGDMRQVWSGAGLRGNCYGQQRWGGVAYRFYSPLDYIMSPQHRTWSYRIWYLPWWILVCLFICFLWRPDSSILNQERCLCTTGCWKYVTWRSSYRSPQLRDWTFKVLGLLIFVETF